jgi:microcystin-dependent protein
MTLSVFPTALDGDSQLATDTTEIESLHDAGHTAMHNTLADAVRKIETAFGVTSLVSWSNTDPADNSTEWAVKGTIMARFSRLASYLATQLATKLTATELVGMIFPYAGSTAPTNYLICNGQSVLRADYLTLYNIIGTTYGVGSDPGGATTFRVPDLLGRVPAGYDAAKAPFNTLGKQNDYSTFEHMLTTSELATHSHAIPHGHTAWTDAQGVHSHAFKSNSASNPPGSGGWTHWTSGAADSSTTSAGSHAHNVGVADFGGSSSTSGTGVAHNNLQPYTALNFIIRAK